MRTPTGQAVLEGAAKESFPVEQVTVLQKNFFCTFQLACSGLQKSWDGIFKLLRRPLIDSKESIPAAYVAWRAGTKTLFLLGSYPP